MRKYDDEKQFFEFLEETILILIFIAERRSYAKK